MAIVNLEAPFAELSGTLEKQGIIHRRKKYKDENGKVIFEGKQEAYAVKHPRDYKKNPPKGEELNNINLFRLAHQRTIAILHSADYTAAELAQLPTDQRAEIEALQSQLADYQTRYKKQLGKTADPLAPIDRTTHRRKHYHTLNTFIRAMLLQEMKSTE